MPRPRVIAIRAGPRELLSEVYGMLEREDVECLEFDNPEQVPEALSRGRGMAVLVYNAPGQPTARRLLRLLRRDWSDVPVVVLVDKASINEFHELMCEGAYDYFEVAEGGSVITNALRWAASTNALPPRVMQGASPHRDLSDAVGTDALLTA